MVVRMTIIFAVDLGVASIRDEGGGNMLDAIIPALKHRIPSEAALWREERVLKGVKKYVLLRYRGRGGNRGKLVSVFEGGGVSSIYRALSIIRQRL